MNKPSFDLFYENKKKQENLNEDYRSVYDDIYRYVLQHYHDVIKANILISTILDHMIDHQNQKNNVTSLIKKDIKTYIQDIDKKIRYKKERETVISNDLERYTISGLWMTMCAYLVLLFCKEFLTQRFLITFSVDLIVGAVALVFMVRGLLTHVQLVKRYQLSKKSLIVEIVGFVVSFVIVLLTLKSPFDITFVLLVIAHLTSKKIFKNELQTR